MSRTFGDQTLFYDADSTKLKDPEYRDLDVIAINGMFNGPEDYHPWQATDRCFWPREYLHPGARVLILNGSIKEASCWQDLLGQGEDLLNILQRFHKHGSAPLLFLCHGLGGFILLRALQRAQEDGLMDHFDPETTRVVFFGTPLKSDKGKDFKKCLGNCAAVELGLRDRILPPPSVDILEVFRGLAELMETAKFQSIAYYELKTSQCRRRGLQGLWDSRCMVVGINMAQVAKARLIALDSDHQQVARLHQDAYNAHLSKFIDELHTSAPTRIVPTPTEDQLHHVPSSSSELGTSNAPLAVHPPQDSNSAPMMNNTLLPNTSELCLSPKLARRDIVPQDQIISPIQSEERNVMQKHATSNESLEPTHEAQISSRILPAAEINLTHLPIRRQSTANLSATSPPLNTLPSLHTITLPEYDYFVDRTEYLKDMVSILLPAISAPSSQESVDTKAQKTKTPAFAIWGSGGLGKTQTALKFTYDHRSRFSYILWATVDREQKLLESFSQYAKSLGIVKKNSNNLVRDAEVLVKWFQELEHPWLLIFDNAKDTRLVNRYWPRSSKGVIIVTSRNAVFATSTVAGNGKELPLLSEAGAIAMLKAALPSSDFEKEEARKAVKKMGYLALGIQALIGLINDAGCALSTFNGQWTSPMSILSDITVQHVYRNFAPYEHALTEVWSGSLHEIQSKDADASSMMNIIALLDPDNIQENLFVVGASETRLENIGFVRNRVRCLQSLKGPGLVAANVTSEETRQRSFHVHRLLQAYTQLQMSNESRQHAFDSASDLLSQLITSRSETDWPKIRLEYKEYFPHVQAVHQFYTSYCATENSIPLKIPVSFLTMLRKAGHLCYKLSFFQLGLELLGTGERVVSSPDWPELVIGDQAALRYEFVEIYYTHACIATEIPNFNMALENFRNAQDKYKEMKACGFEMEKSYVITGGIANSLNGLGRDTEAEPLFLEALAARPKGPKKFSAYEVNIARCMMVQGKLKGASDRLLEFIQRRENAFGSDDTQDYLAGHAFFVLGNVRIREEKYDVAFDLHQRALRCWKETYGEGHHKIGNGLVKLAWHHSRMGQYEEALKYLDSALDIYRGGTDQEYRKRDIARVLYRKSLAFTNLKDEIKAQKCLKEAENLRKEVWQDEENIPPASEQVYDEMVNLWAR